MRTRPIRRATTRLVLALGVLCLAFGLLQGSIGLTGWPTEWQRPADLATALLLLGLGVTLVSFRRG